MRSPHCENHRQIARRALSLVSALEKLDKYDLIVLDDPSYVRKALSHWP
jgi:hypothetical protein